MLHENEYINYLAHDCVDSEITLSQCVNPYEVHPIDLHSIAQDQICNLAVQNLTGEDLVPRASAQLEMEEFGDLSLFLPKSTPKFDLTDELNTPVFDKEPFDFTVPSNNSYDWHAAESHDSSRKLVKNDEVMPNNYGLKLTYLGNNIMYHQNKDIIDLKKEKEIYNSRSNTPVYVQTIDHDYHQQNADMLHQDVYSDVSLAPSPVDTFGTQESNSRMTERRLSFKPNLKLDVEIKFAQNDVNTPDVIAALASMDENFDLFNYTNYKEEQTVAEEENSPTQQSPSSLVAVPEGLATIPEVEQVSGLESPSPLWASGEVEQASISSAWGLSTIKREDLEETSVSNQDSEDLPVKRTRKRKNYDSDEDYVPPKKIRGTKSTVAYDSDSNDSYIPTPKKRGRPPGRRISTVSFSSSASVCSGKDDKYRELRDKNNEASRRSRLKRRMKEQGLEQELDQLNERNIKLKTEVEQLEKLLKIFKDHLFSNKK